MDEAPKSQDVHQSGALRGEPEAAGQDRADAARYRWLRDHSATYSTAGVPIQLIVQEHADVHTTHGAVGYRAGLDQAIDAAASQQADREAE